MVGFNYGRFCTSYRGLLRIYQGQGHVKKKKKTCFWEELSVGCFPLTFLEPLLSHWKERGAGVGTKMFQLLCASAPPINDICSTTIRPRIMLSLE